MLAGLALATLLRQDGLLAAPAKPTLEKPKFDLIPKQPPHAPQASAMISLFMQGGPSHIDMTDPKPELQKLHMQNFPGEIKYDNAAESSAKVYASPFKFTPQGQCGMELSELLPGLGSIADDITLIRSMHTDVNNHGQSLYALNTGRITVGRPSIGSWLTYGLGSESQNLPAYCVLTDPGGLPVLGTDMWSNGWLPSLFQGTVIRPKEPRILNLDPPPNLAGEPQGKFLDYLREINRDHLADHPGENDLAARIASYELAARMQSAAKEALDISQETAATQEMYGLNEDATREFGTRCLIARRLVERGVRYVQLFTQTQQWDHHGALLTVIQNEKNVGRDHNTYGFSWWLAGGGVKAGHVHGATDEFGHKALLDKVSHTDFHVTLMHMFGFGSDQLFYQRPNGPATLLDGQTGRLVTEVLNRAPASA